MAAGRRPRKLREVGPGLLQQHFKIVRSLGRGNFAAV